MSNTMPYSLWMIFWANLKGLIRFAFFTEWLTDINKDLTSLCSIIIRPACLSLEGHPCHALEVRLTKVRGERCLKTLSLINSYGLTWFSLWFPDIKAYYVFLCSLRVGSTFLLLAISPWFLRPQYSLRGILALKMGHGLCRQPWAQILMQILTDYGKLGVLLDWFLSFSPFISKMLLILFFCEA